MTFGPSYVLAHDFGGTTTGGGGGSGEPPQAPGPGKSPDPGQDPIPCPVGSYGKPVTLFNGAEDHSATDLTVKGVFPIEIRRRYDNQSTYDSPLGYGWIFQHDRRLYEYPDNSVVIRHGCGRREKFVYSGGAYVTPVGNIFGQLKELGGGGFTFTYNSLYVDHYDAQGRLVAIEDPRGNRLELTYDPRGKLPLTGTSAFAVDPAQPLTVAYNYRLTKIEERAADGVLTGHFVSFEYDETTGRLTAASSNDGRSVSYDHDQTTGGLTQGNLVQVNGLDGLIWIYAYDDPNDAHNLTSLQTGASTTPYVNTYDDQDRVIRQVLGNSVLDFAYPFYLTQSTVTRTVTDATGANPYQTVTTYEFDEQGYVTRVTDALGNERRYTYNTLKLISREELWQSEGGSISLLRATDYTYDAAGDKLSEAVTLDSGETITRTWTYDHNRVSSEQVQSSAAPATVFRTEFTFYYDSSGVPTNIKERKQEKADGSFQTTSYTYDGRQRLLTTTFPDGVTIVREYTGEYVTRTYYQDGGVSLPELEVHFGYDAQGNPNQIRDAKGNLTQLDYDDRGRITKEINSLGEETRYTYDAQGLLTRIESGYTPSAGEGQVTQFVYNNEKRLTTVQRKNAGGTFDDLFSYTYDSAGNRLTQTDAVGRTTRFAYDPLDRMTAVADPLDKQTTFAYDAAGNRTGVVDALGRQTVFIHDDLDRLIQTEQRGVTPAAITEFTYDAAGSLVSVNDPENSTTTYQYDRLSQNTSVTQPLGQRVQYDYDARGRVVEKINARGQRIEYDYAAWGGLIEERRYGTTGATIPQQTITYGYDLNANLTSVTDNTVQAAPLYTQTYDALDRPDVQTLMYIPGGDWQIDNDYDRFGNRSRLTLARDVAASVQSFDFDKRNLLTSIELPNTQSIAFDYFGNDDLKSIAYPNGVTTDYTYENNGPVKTIVTHDSAATINRFDYLYNDVLNVTTLNAFDGDRIFSYDGLDRLTGAQYPVASGLPEESYTYDLVGNREDPSDPSAYDYDANHRILKGQGLTYIFDDDGNQISRSDGAQFHYDQNNRLREFSQGGVHASYAYDPLGRRIKKTVNGAATWFLWDGTRLLAETDSAGTVVRQYVYAGDQPVAVYEPDASVPSDCDGSDVVLTNTTVGAGQVFNCSAVGSITVASDGLVVVDGGTALLRSPKISFGTGTSVHVGGILSASTTGVLGNAGEALYAIHTDHLGTPRSITDEDGSMVWRWNSDAFGSTPPEQDPDGDGQEVVLNLRFLGQYSDQETELHYNYFRYFAPNTGRYTTEDPKGSREHALELFASLLSRSSRPVDINPFSFVSNNPLKWSDPEGLDYWVEGPVPGEGGFGLHESVCVGKPKGERLCISFGHDDLATEDDQCVRGEPVWPKPDCGRIYEDYLGPGPLTGMYRYTSQQVDSMITALFDSILHDSISRSEPYWLIGNNCRTFSENMYHLLVNLYGGSTKAPVLDNYPVDPGGYWRF